MLYDHTVHMSHFGRSGTVLDTPNTLVSILNLTTIYCCQSVWVSCTQTSTNTGEMRGMRDWGEWITKGIGVIRVSCYTAVTLLEHGRMRLRAHHVNKGGEATFAKQHAGRMEPVGI